MRDFNLVSAVSLSLAQPAAQAGTPFEATLRFAPQGEGGGWHRESAIRPSPTPPPRPPTSATSPPARRVGFSPPFLAAASPARAKRPCARAQRSGGLKPTLRDGAVERPREVPSPTFADIGQGHQRPRAEIQGAPKGPRSTLADPTVCAINRRLAQPAAQAGTPFEATLRFAPQGEGGGWHRESKIRPPPTPPPPRAYLCNLTPSISTSAA